MASTAFALRLARQFRAQGHYSASPRVAGRGTAAGDCRVARTNRLAATVSLLRRPHDHHRDLRAMAATTRATSRDRTNREQSVVTRHGLHSPPAATPPLRRMPGAYPSPRSARQAWISAAASSRSTVRLAKNLAHQVTTNASAEPGSPSPHPSKTRNPHRPSPQPRGFVHGRFSYA
jgi:hypothetical protein